jgi:adenine deaminase
MARYALRARSASRRLFLKHAAAVAAGGTLFGAGARVVGAQVCPDGAGDVALVNGRFLTLDSKNTVAGAVTIRGGRFAEVGTVGQLRPCAKTIDLKGATVIPGLIDSHVHFIR